MNKYFTGRYYKHQANGETLCVILGKTRDEEFLQIITNHEAFYYPSLKGCKVTSHSLTLNLPRIQGHVEYGPFLPLKQHIMGPFKWLPMQCNHEIISMRHSTHGAFHLNDRTLNFNHGIGYIEGDKGRSFPKEYMWLHCNDFKIDLSITVAIAHIPFAFFDFTGCICNINYAEKEYRLATYNGVKIRSNSNHKLHLQQGKYDLIIRIWASNSRPLRAPKSGIMNDIIYESTTTTITVSFYYNNTLLFTQSSANATYEREPTS